MSWFTAIAMVIYFAGFLFLVAENRNIDKEASEGED
jgi:hypothetical protein